VKANLDRRLKQLEQVREGGLETERYREQEQEGRLAIEKMREWLRAESVEQQPHESLAETVARASGITVQELRQQLTERAAGRL
jgi:hypothetical protein